MAEMCATWPYVDGEPSKLYKDLYKYTNKNRKLTNYLYVVAIQPYFKEKFTSSDLNDQGEVSSDKVIEALLVLDLITISDTIKNTLSELKALEPNGDLHIFSSVSEIFERVLEINLDNNSKVIARINRVDGGYTISVEERDATNFMIGDNYEAGNNLLMYIRDLLLSKGFNLNNLSLESYNILNPLNVRSIIGTIETFQKLNRKFGKEYGKFYLSSNEASLLIDLMEDDPKLKRLKATFGDSIIDAILYYLSLSEELPITLQGYKDNIETLLNTFNAFRNSIVSKFKDLDVKLLNQEILREYTETVSSENKALKESLNELYCKWHLNKDSVTSLYSEITTIDLAIDHIISRLENNIKVLKARGSVDVLLLEKLLKEIDDINTKKEKKEYAKSIINFLNSALDTIASVENMDTSLADEDSYNDLASSILSAKELLLSYLAILSLLLNIDLLEHSDDLEQSDIRRIKDLASKVLSSSTSLTLQIARKEFLLVYKFLKKYWGKENKTFEGMGSFELALWDSLDHGTIHMNILDLGIFAMTEVSDPVISTLGESIKSIHELRDDKLRKILLDIRRATERLLKSGSDSRFMMEELSDGTVKIISEIDYDAFEKARQEKLEYYKRNNYRGARLHDKMLKWEEDNMDSYEVPSIKVKALVDGEEKEIPYTITAPNKKYRKSLPSMTNALLDYYNIMLTIKALLEYDMGTYGVRTSLYNPVQITGDATQILSNASPSEAIAILLEKALGLFNIREDDTLFGNLEVIADSEGNVINRLPAFYLRKLSDLKKLNRNFSLSMLAFSAMAVNHNTLAAHINMLELAKDFLMERPITLSRGERLLVEAAESMGTLILTPVVKKSKETAVGTYLNNLFESKVYGVKHKTSGAIAGKFSIDKAVDRATLYTSTTGLVANVPGAIANALVGKLLMIIEAGASEFFGFKDYTYASTKYWAMLPDLLKEVMSNNKQSDLGLLMEFFDVKDDFYEELRRSGIYDNDISKIIGNTNLFFLYGLGEHLLHALTMIACLNHIKVKNLTTGKKGTLLDVFRKEVKDDNGELILEDNWVLDNKEGIEIPITMEYIKLFKKRISYANRSMHGAFGDDEKGMIHRYALGRLVMNFRLWMPAHYARRFNKLHWDADLGDFREGYYITCWKFTYQCIKDLCKGLFLLATRWNKLGTMLKTNMRRVITEVVLLGMLAMLSRMDFGDDPKNRSWASAMLKYLIKRMLMETRASTPFSGSAFFTNIYKTLNSPIAAISSMQKLTTLFNIDDLIFMRTVLSGEHEGDLKYFLNMERAIPFYLQVDRWLNMDTDNSLFKLFDD